MKKMCQTFRDTVGHLGTCGHLGTAHTPRRSTIYSVYSMETYALDLPRMFFWSICRIS